MKKKLNVKLTLNKRSVSELNNSVKNNLKGGATDSCQPFCNTFYSCDCPGPTLYWGCNTAFNTCTKYC